MAWFNLTRNLNVENTIKFLQVERLRDAVHTMSPWEWRNDRSQRKTYILSHVLHYRLTIDAIVIGSELVSAGTGGVTKHPTNKTLEPVGALLISRGPMVRQRWKPFSSVVRIR
jgi:hypothetical protein